MMGRMERSSRTRESDDRNGRNRKRKEDFVVERPLERRLTRASFNDSGTELSRTSFNESGSELAQPNPSVPNRDRDSYPGFMICPDDRWYRIWKKFILLWAIYSSVFTPMEFGFFRGLPRNLFALDIVGQVVFLIDIVFQFFIPYQDSQGYMIYKRPFIALRYLKSTFLVDFLACIPWDIIFKASKGKEGIRYLLWIRLCRVRKITRFLQSLEKDIRINYMFTRIVRLLTVEFYCCHTAACIFYYLATTLPPNQEGYTWIGSLTLGDFSYSHFRDIDLWKRYITSLYFAIVTMATVGYGEIYAVNPREMIFISIYVSFDMILGAYLIGNMTALIVRNSKRETFRDKMEELQKYMNRNGLCNDLCNQIKSHLRLQYESSCTDSVVLQDVPINLRGQISQTLYLPYIEKSPLFKGCSSEFINQIVIGVHEEFFLPGEVILKQGDVVDQLYFVCHGLLEMIVDEDGEKKTISCLGPSSTFGEISIFCNVPQSFTVRVCDLCRLLRLDKQSVINTLKAYFYDGQKIYNNMIEAQESRYILKHGESDIISHLAIQDTELVLKVNYAAYCGDLYQLKNLIRSGADPKKTDYDGRSPLHLAAAKGHEDVVLFLIQGELDLNISDNFGNTPLLEAVKNGNDQVAALLFKEGARMNVEDVGSFLCTIVSQGDSDLLKRAFSNGIDPNSKDFNQRTPLHIASSQGLYLMAKLLIESGAGVFVKDRWGNTPLDEARGCGNKNLIKLLEDAKDAQSPQNSIEEVKEEKQPKKCTVYPCHPWRPQEKSISLGIVLRVPRTIKELVKMASEKLELPSAQFILSEDGGKIIEVDMIDNNQKLYLIN